MESAKAYIATNEYFVVCFAPDLSFSQETESLITTGRIVFGSELKIASNQEARAFARMSQAVARHGQAREAIRQHYRNKPS